MDEERTNLTESRKEITAGGYRFVMIWAVCLLILYAVDASFGVVKLRGRDREDTGSADRVADHGAELEGTRS
jgi:hypothetical protein